MNIEDILSAHLELITTDIERWLDLFAEDAVVEFPYAASLGAPARLEGRPAISRYFVETIKIFQGLTFSKVNRYLTSDPDVGLLEGHGSATITTTGKRYEQDYVVLVKIREGRIVLYREYWNPLAVIPAFGLEHRS